MSQEQVPNTNQDQEKDLNKLEQELLSNPDDNTTLENQGLNPTADLEASYQGVIHYHDQLNTLEQEAESSEAGLAEIRQSLNLPNDQQDSASTQRLKELQSQISTEQQKANKQERDLLQLPDGLDSESEQTETWKLPSLEIETESQQLENIKEMNEKIKELRINAVQKWMEADIDFVREDPEGYRAGYVNSKQAGNVLIAQIKVSFKNCDEMKTFIETGESPETFERTLMHHHQTNYNGDKHIIRTQYLINGKDVVNDILIKNGLKKNSNEKIEENNFNK